MQKMQGEKKQANQKIITFEESEQNEIFHKLTLKRFSIGLEIFLMGIL